MSNININLLQKALEATNNRLKELENRHKTAIDGYKYSIEQDIINEKLIIAVLTDKINEVKKCAHIWGYTEDIMKHLEDVMRDIEDNI